jgi:ferredoxin
MDEDNCMVDVAKFYMDFICDESCGKCSPCRIGTKRLLEILEKITSGNGTLEDLDKLETIAETVKNSSLCGLGQTAPNPVLSTIINFRDEYLAHIQDKECPAHVCKKLIQYQIQESKCKKCSLCQRNCPAGAISGSREEGFKIDQSKCIKCGQCFSACKFSAIIKK